MIQQRNWLALSVSIGSSLLLGMTSCSSEDDGLMLPQAGSNTAGNGGSAGTDGSDAGSENGDAGTGETAGKGGSRSSGGSGGKAAGK
ncbi:MAG TPA: hypothetical protein VGK73_08060, partial [Polyangiaceae bacterium]